MSAAGRLALEWWDDEYGEDYPDGAEFDKQSILEAFGAGFDAAVKAGWFGADGPFHTGQGPQGAPYERD